MNAPRTVATVCIVAASMVPHAGHAAAQETTSRQSQGQPLEVVTHGRAIQAMTVVDRSGERVGAIYDFVVDFRDGSVRYVLLTDVELPAGTTSANTDASDQNATGATQETSDESAGDATGGGGGSQSGDSDSDSGGDAAARAKAMLYPIPVSGLQIAERPSQGDNGETGRSGTGGASAGTDGAGGTGSNQAALSDDDPLAALTVGNVEGMDVETLEGDTISQARGVITGSDGTVQLVLGVGGFLGMGEKTIGLPLSSVQLGPEGEVLVTSSSRDALEAAQELTYEPSQVLPAEMRLREAAQRAAEQRAKAASDNANGGESKATGDAQGGDQTAEAKQPAPPAVDTLKNKVLVLGIDKKDLSQAPGFSREKFPEVLDPQWFAMVTAFYQNLLKN